MQSAGSGPGKAHDIAQASVPTTGLPALIHDAALLRSDGGAGSQQIMPPFWWCPGEGQASYCWTVLPICCAFPKNCARD